MLREDPRGQTGSVGSSLPMPWETEQQQPQRSCTLTFWCLGSRSAVSMCIYTERLASHESAQLRNSKWCQPPVYTSTEYSHLAPISQQQTRLQKHLVRQEGTKCWQCLLWVCFRLINGHVKQHGGNFCHPPNSSFMSKIKLVCSAGLHISAGHWAVKATAIKPKRLFHIARVDLI